MKKQKEKLPRGIRRRGDSLVVSFALKDLRCGAEHVPGCECGKIERVSLGPVTTAYAVEQLGIYKRQVRQGCYVRRHPRREPEPVKEITCTDLWNAYEKDCRTREVKRIDRCQLAWSHLEPVFGSKPAAAVRPKDIFDYIAARRESGTAAGTCNREVAILKAAFRHGARLGMLAYIPVFPKKLKEANPRQGFVEEEAYQTLAGNCRDLWLRCFLGLGFNYGFRKSEMLNLRVWNVDLLNGWLTIETSKNGEGRRVKLTQETATLLTECIRSKQADDFVLTRQDGSRVAQPRKDWYSLCVKCGLGKLDDKGRYSGLQMHDLRRSAVRHLLRRGVREKVAMAISGHKTRSVFDRYNITNERDIENAAKLLEPGRQASSASTESIETDTKTDTRGFARA